MNDKVLFEMDDEDLEKLRAVFESVRKSQDCFNKDEVIAALNKLLEDVKKDEHVPKFIMSRLQQLELMVDIITDEEWNLPQEDVDHILEALAYFADTNDLIPDKVPGIGYIDDAIMVEIAMQRLRPEVESYNDFCEFRATETQRLGDIGEAARISREDWLQSKRSELQVQLRKKRRWYRPFS